MSCEPGYTPLQDGKQTDGTTVPNGSYNIAITASNGGTQLVAQPLQFALVQGVTKGSNGNLLIWVPTAPPHSTKFGK